MMLVANFWVVVFRLSDFNRWTGNNCEQSCWRDEMDFRCVMTEGETCSPVKSEWMRRNIRQTISSAQVWCFLVTSLFAVEVGCTNSRKDTVQSSLTSINQIARRSISGFAFCRRSLVLSLETVISRCNKETQGTFSLRQSAKTHPITRFEAQPFYTYK